MSAVFNEQELLDRVDNDWDFLAETVQILCTDGRVLMDQVQQAAQSGDARKLGFSAHTLKGMISNFCSPAAQASAFELEKMGRGGDLAAAPAAVKILELRLNELIAALNQFLATRTPCES